MSREPETEQEKVEHASVLVVDDNPLITDVLRGLLRSENYQVFTSRNGKEALDVVGSKKIDVIICDIMMPKMGGYEFFDVIRAKPECSHIPFIFLTALDSRDEVEQGKGIGADDYLCKPFEPRELLAVVKGKVVRSRGLLNMSEERYDSYRRRVIHTLSHEFRTPLVAINTGMELLLEQNQTKESPKTKSLLEAVRRGGMRLEKLVNDFMVLQQIDAGVAKRLYEHRASVTTVTSLIDRFLDARQGVYETLGAQLSVIDHSDCVSVKVLESQMIDCLDRLVSNAVKFSPKEKLVEIQIYVVEKEVFIDVRDRGIGLNPDKLDEAIDIFGQIDRERLEQQGGGLGLPIASHYASICGGRLEFEPRQGGGSIVSVVLPIAS